MDAWDMEIDVVNNGGSTTSTLYRDGDKVHTWDLGDVWIPQEGDFDWNVIYWRSASGAVGADGPIGRKRHSH